MSTFTGEFFITGLDALTVVVMLEHMPAKETRASYMRLTNARTEPRAYDSCLDCMIRSFQTRIGDDGRAAIIDKIARGKVVVLALERYRPGQFCERCASHMKFVDFANRLFEGMP